MRGPRLQALVLMLLIGPLMLLAPPAPAEPVAAGPAPGQSLGLELGLSAVHNLRDLGGYRTADGAEVVDGRVYRSDQFNPVDDADLTKLAQLGITRNFDLRTDGEVAARPDQVPAGWNYRHLDVLADEDQVTGAQIEQFLSDPQRVAAELGGGRVETVMADTYRTFVTLPSARSAYAELFGSLTDPAAGPAVFHCTAGKDRTGWAAAALLSLLGVPRDQVYADYLRSNDYLLPYHAKMIDEFAAVTGDRALFEGLFGVRPSYLDAAFDEVTRSYGSIENYFADGLGIDAAGQQQLRAALLHTPSDPLRPAR